MDGRGQTCSDPHPLPFVLLAAITAGSIDVLGLDAGTLAGLAGLALVWGGAVLVGGGFVNLVVRLYATQWRVIP